MFTKDEITLLLNFLDELTDYQSNAGCNDYWLPKNWTDEQKEEFMNNYLNWAREYYGEPDFNGLDDSSVTYYLMSKLKKLREVI